MDTIPSVFRSEASLQGSWVSTVFSAIQSGGGPPAASTLAMVLPGSAPAESGGSFVEMLATEFSDSAMTGQLNVKSCPSHRNALAPVAKDDGKNGGDPSAVNTSAAVQAFVPFVTVAAPVEPLPVAAPKASGAGRNGVARATEQGSPLVDFGSGEVKGSCPSEKSASEMKSAGSKTFREAADEAAPGDCATSSVPQSEVPQQWVRQDGTSAAGAETSAGSRDAIVVAAGPSSSQEARLASNELQLIAPAANQIAQADLSLSRGLQVSFCLPQPNQNNAAPAQPIARSGDQVNEKSMQASAPVQQQMNSATSQPRTVADGICSQSKEGTLTFSVKAAGGRNDVEDKRPGANHRKIYDPIVTPKPVEGRVETSSVTHDVPTDKTTNNSPGAASGGAGVSAEPTQTSLGANPQAGKTEPKSDDAKPGVSSDGRVIAGKPLPQTSVNPNGDIAAVQTANPSVVSSAASHLPASEPASKTVGHDLQITDPGMAPPPQVHAAKIVQSDGHGEMRFDVRTQSLGEVEIRAAISGKDVQLAVSAERGDVRSFLTPEMPSLQSALQQHDLRLEYVRTGLNTGTTPEFSSGSGRQEQRFARPRPRGETLFRPETTEDFNNENFTRGLSIRI